MCDMNHSSIILRSIVRIGAFYVLCSVAVFGPVIAGATDADLLPEGIAVSVDDVTGRNSTTIRIGADVLAIDLEHGSTSGQPPRYRLVTAALGGAESGASIVLWPRKRPREDTATEQAVVVFSSGFTLAGADREVVLFDLGRCATAGDVAVWLPKERLLITGRIASRGRVEATLETDLVSWIDALERLRGLDPTIVVPGHGHPGGAAVLSDQVGRLKALRDVVESGLLSGKPAAEIIDTTTMEWFLRWRSQEPGAVGIATESMIAEVGGLRTPWELSERRGLREGKSPTSNDPGWRPPRKVLWRDYWPDRLPLLAVVAPGVEIVPFETSEQALEHVADADAIIGTATPELLAAGSKLRWVQVGSAGVERYLAIPELGSGRVLLTNGQKLASPEIAEHVMALTRALARGLRQSVEAQMAMDWRRSDIASEASLQRLRGKTLLVVGLGGIGTEVARLASAAEMRVTGIRSSRRSGPPFVDQVGLTEELAEFAAEADVVVNCLPMTPDTADIFDATLFKVMKPTAFFVNVGRGGTVDTEALVFALVKGEIAGAGLDVTDPEPLPSGHPLWKAPNTVITPHYAAWSDIGRERRWLLYRENLRRFVAGEPLLSVVDPERGY
jgi:phosphoglycerate dehydrogenase-like enzyme